MKIEALIYVYMAICISMIVFNVVYLVFLRGREKRLVGDAEKMKRRIRTELDALRGGGVVSEKHKRFLMRALEKSSALAAYDKALEEITLSEGALCERYLASSLQAFKHLTGRYARMDTLKMAYFPYLLDKYDLLRLDENGEWTAMLFRLLQSENVYCRENTLKAIYDTKNPSAVARALEILDRNPFFHHPKLICDGLLAYGGDKNELKELLFSRFNAYSVRMQETVLRYVTAAAIRADEKMLSLLQSESAPHELRFAAIAYFEAFPNEEARAALGELASRQEGRFWEYVALASSALKSYPGESSFEILVKNLSSEIWEVRKSSAMSLVALGYSYYDLLCVFDGNDRFARETMRYFLDRQKAEGGMRAWKR